MFITLEGIEGCGKSTQAKRLAGVLPGAVVTRQPGGTPLGLRIRELLLTPSADGPVPEAELLLFFADRAQHVFSVIRPALAAGRVVVCDRYTDSSLAYQGHGRGLPLDLLRGVHQLATGGLWPDLTLLLDIDVEESLRRIHARGGPDRLEAEKLHFHERVRDGYLAMAAAEPARWVVVDGRGSEDQVFERLRQVVDSRIQERVRAV
jgi:dTMP kinase